MILLQNNLIEISENFSLGRAGSREKTPKNGRKMEAAIRRPYPVAGFSRLWSVLAEAGRRPPSDMITVLLLPPCYHFPDFSHRKRQLSHRFLAEIHGIEGQNHWPGYKPSRRIWREVSYFYLKASTAFNLLAKNECNKNNNMQHFVQNPSNFCYQYTS